MQLSPDEVLPWLVRDGAGRAMGPSHETREDAEHAAGKMSGAAVCRDNYSAANAGRHQRFLGIAPMTVRPMTRFGAWGGDDL